MTAPALFELIEFTDLESLPMPDNGPYFVATKEGYMVMQPSHFGPTLTRATKIERLPEGVAAIWKDIPLIPASVVGQAWSFFRAIFDRQKSEAMVDITWSEEHGYRLFVPPQRASYGGVEAQRNPEHIKGLHVGTMHSHADFTAFHSGTDKHDADQHNGIHFTIGKVTSNPPEIVAMISQNGVHWDMRLEEVIDGAVELVPHPKRWENYVQEPQKTSPAKKTGSSLVVVNHNRNQQASSPAWWDEGDAYDRYWQAKWNAGRTDSVSADRKLYNLDEVTAHMNLDKRQIDLVADIDYVLDEAQRALDQLGIDLDFEFQIQVPHNKPAATDDIPAEWRHLL